MSIELKIPRYITDKTHAYLKKRGRERKEGVVLWQGTINPIQITDMIIPEQIAGDGFFKVDMAERQKIARQLAGNKYKIVAQVHSHPNAAFHSIIDDREAIPRQVGALSLVVPDYASRQSIFDGSMLYQLQQDGSWAEASIEVIFGIHKSNRLRRGMEWLIGILKRLAH